MQTKKTRLTITQKKPGCRYPDYIHYIFYTSESEQYSGWNVSTIASSSDYAPYIGNRHILGNNESIDITESRFIDWIIGLHKPFFDSFECSEVKSDELMFDLNRFNQLFDQSQLQ